jgi:hypothetical protein
MSDEMGVTVLRHELSEAHTEIRKLRDKLSAIVATADAYVSDEVDARDLSSSWTKLAALLSVCRSARALLPDTPEDR